MEDINTIIENVELGNVEAQYTLGICYDGVDGVPKDFEKALDELCERMHAADTFAVA